LRKHSAALGRSIAHIDADALAILCDYDYPGNVRELENLIERAYALGARDQIRLVDLPALGGVPPSEPGPAASAKVTPAATTVPTLAQAERDLILRALDIHGNDRAKAARALGLSSRTLYRRLKEYGIN
jgi:DNA-binding NtrC family response regulator